jgi:hypothetical protein
MTFETSAVNEFLDNVVHVNFLERRAFLSPKESYIHCVATHLDEMDFQDFVEAVNDKTGKFYANLDRDMKDLVDGFFQQVG